MLTEKHEQYMKTAAVEDNKVHLRRFSDYAANVDARPYVHIHTKIHFFLTVSPLPISPRLTAPARWRLRNPDSTFVIVIAITSLHVVSLHVVSLHVVSLQVISLHVISSRHFITSSHFTSSHFTSSHHVISLHVISSRHLASRPLITSSHFTSSRCTSSRFTSSHHVPF